MFRFLSKLSAALRPMSPRDRYLYAASDLADLEHRQKAWDNMTLDRDRFFRY